MFFLQSLIHRRASLPFISIVLIIVLSWSAQKWVDPDFGWHYRIGEIIATSGIPTNNPFSYTMPSYPYMDHSWLSSLLYFYVDKTFGYSALAILHSILMIATPYIALGGIKKGHKYWLIPFSLVLACFLPRFGVRPQVFSWFFLSILVRIFYDDTQWEKLKWFFPILMLLWVNFHGSYLLGMCIAFVLMLFKSYERKKIIYSDFSILFVSLIATFLNPYGSRIWIELLKQMFLGDQLRRTISEWLPAFFTFDMGFFSISVFTLTLIVANRKKVKLRDFAMLFFSIIAGLYSGRYAPLSVLLISPLFLNYLSQTRKKAAKIPFGTKRFHTFTMLLTIVSLAIFMFSFLMNLNQARKLSENNFYPKHATEFLQKQDSLKNVFVDYSFGGYFIWKLPDKKYFVDGRMDVLTWNAPHGESNYAYQEYLQIMCGEVNLKEKLDQYKIDTVVEIKSRSSVNNSGAHGTLHDNLKNLFVLLGFLHCDKGISLSEKMTALGWKKAYEDDQAVIFVR